jgi:hypothetical protein
VSPKSHKFALAGSHPRKFDVDNACITVNNLHYCPARFTLFRHRRNLVQNWLTGAKCFERVDETADTTSACLAVAGNSPAVRKNLGGGCWSGGALPDETPPSHTTTDTFSTPPEVATVCVKGRTHPQRLQINQRQ